MRGLWSAISPSQLRGKVQCGRGGGVCAVKPRGAAGGKLAPGGLAEKVTVEGRPEGGEEVV